MKVRTLVLTVFLLATVAAAQAQSTRTDAPGISVVEKKWEKKERPRQLVADLVSDHERNIEYERSMKETMYENTVRAKAGERPLRLPNPPRPTPATPNNGRSSQEYVYEVKVVNTGKKKIKEIAWGYVLYDSDTGREVGHQRFTSKVTINPGKSKNLVGHSQFSPARVVDVKKAGEERPGQYDERVVIHRIEYKDGSAWERPSR